MSAACLQALEYDGEGYRILLESDSWRVAHLNFLEKLHPNQNDSMERHLETDEVFILVAGQGLLIIGVGEDEIERLDFQPLKPGAVYNVPRRTWHTLILTRDGRVVIVENRDTGEANSQFCALPPRLREELRDVARKSMPGCWDK